MLTRLANSKYAVVWTEAFAVTEKEINRGYVLATLGEYEINNHFVEIDDFYEFNEVSWDKLFDNDLVFRITGMI